MPRPLLQIALDLIDLKKALELARVLVENNVDIVEAGTPLLYAHGVRNVIPKLRQIVGDRSLISADLKISDAGALSSKIAFEHEADIVSVIGVASEKTILDALDTAKEYGGQVMVDLICSKNLVDDALKALKLGADYVLVHVGLDQQSSGVKVVDRLERIGGIIPPKKLAVAGGITPQNAHVVLKYNPAIMIVGGAVYRSPNPAEVLRKLKEIIQLSGSDQ
ncbi:MAG: orotidine 5'-phosphate decarboxylase / HUMPS family protein [Candidatus Njordarchaeales archaeon]